MSHGAYVSPVEVWLRGPIPDVTPLLQPVAHALLQVAEEVKAAVEHLTPNELWAQPGGAASVGFHVTHAAGALDRLFTYARGELLSEEQLTALRGERALPGGAPPHADWLVNTLQLQVESALPQLRETRPETLSHPRAVGRKALPSSVLGLLFHGAEHTTRHIGQAITTARIVRGLRSETAPESGK